MDIKILDDFKDKFDSLIGEKTSAGQSKVQPMRKTISAQYPAERASGNDGIDDLRINDLYKNGLLFTAYDYKSRTTPDLRSMRSSVIESVRNSFDPVKGTTVGAGTQFDKNPIANILLPRSKSDTDSISHKFNDVGESLITRGAGTATGVLSNVASTTVFGAIESITQGWMSDHGEQIYNTARSMYAGPDNRSKVFTWDLTPRNVQDLIQIINIYETFNYFSYGETGNSNFAADLKEQIDSWYKTTFINNLTPTGADTSNTMMEQVTSFLSNVIVVSNPTVWFIRNFGKTSSFDGRPDVFGPCQIQSIRFDKSPNGNFNGLAIAPNLPSSFVLEITFREILTLNRGTLYNGAL
ncbi:baseplate tail tube cap [Escherichia phage EcS1]|uniref:Baseplate tail tube cap n=1 Tax=Escherichia phage EcS1 TaxID=2083276 RepID=A0A2Z5ZC80_9CAUD|nr:baseplate tail tube cap [Escherichia phage EcS1]BBC78260.1 Baseplate tail tube cap [Escherichia phage EcS1]